MNIDPIWLIAAGFFLLGLLCGWAWHAGQIESARAEGMQEGYAQGRADAITVARQQLAREMGHETTPVQSVREAIRRANHAMQHQENDNAD